MGQGRACRALNAAPLPFGVFPILRFVGSARAATKQTTLVAKLFAKPAIDHWALAAAAADDAAVKRVALEKLAEAYATCARDRQRVHRCSTVRFHASEFNSGMV